MQDVTLGPLKHAVVLSIGTAGLMIGLGILAIALPGLVGVGIAVLMAWTVIAGGCLHWLYAIHAFAAEQAAQGLWRFLVSVLYLLGGIYLAVHPELGLASLTFLLGLIFLSEAIMRTIDFLLLRYLPRSGWILFDAVMTLLLGAVMLRRWPGDSAWAIGTLVGINLVGSGFTRLMASVAARRAFAAAEPSSRPTR